MLSTLMETEITELSARYGHPERLIAELPSLDCHPLTMTDRVGEVCMVLRRKNGMLVTATKTFYPPGAFRLLTGGIGPGESIEGALLREVAEETGLDVEVRRFLAVIEYRQGRAAYPHILVARRPDMLSMERHFATLAFLLDEVGGVFGVRDTEEQIGEFREVSIDDLPAIAEALERAPDLSHPTIAGSWRTWGSFRAVVHRVVHRALQ